MELVTTCIPPVCNVLVDWVSPKLRNMWYLKKNMDECETSKNTLETKGNDVEIHMNLEETNRRCVSGEIKDWFNKYQCISQKYSEFYKQFSEYRREGRWSRVRKKTYKFCQEVVRMMKEINQLIDEANSFLLNAGEMPPPIVEIENTEFTHGLPSMEWNKKAVYKALEEQNVNVIGMETRSDFKFVIMVTVSSNLDIKKIQDQIERRLPKNNVSGIMDDQRSAARANILSRRLEKVEGNILIIFDDVWEPLNFTEIGIPSSNKSCKIILTTRDQIVCETMGAKEIIIDALGTDESWKLFESINVCSNKDVDPEVKHAVCKECAGLPLAISVVAKSLNNIKLIEAYWLKSLRYLKTADPIGMGGRNGIVYKSVKLSYDGLEENKLKICFLLCSLFPEDCVIDLFDLICYGIEEEERWAEYAKKGIDSLNDFLDILNHLKSRGLILQQQDWDSDVNINTARMHDIVRDVAINIAKEEGFFIKTGAGLEDWPRLYNKELKWISLMDNSFKDFTHRPENVEMLKLLSLKGNKELKRIESDFFKGMQNLLFLDLRETSISDLTPWIQKLKKLGVLMYGGNRSYEIFKQIPISILGNLSVLCLQHSKIKELDKDFGKLFNLRVIDFTRTEIDIIRSKVFSSLKNLEVLYMHNSFHHWKASNDEFEDCVAFEELSTLKHLYSLRVDIKNKDIFSVKYRVAGNFPSIKHFSIRSIFGYLWKFPIMDFNYLALDQNIVILVKEEISQWLKLLLIKTKRLRMVVDCSHSARALMNLDYEDIHVMSIKVCSVIIKISSFNEKHNV
ncbi:NB-ARC domain-containing disease resistance protein [Zostera marina]|uniref:NB-ARC domain-containing disease resistance protein n=1 Tax=Zostera marina TaxID=29655 RepID=A0A0K9NLS3_ZOSMR|nr:NB-ARC domain-containing disease resistance protein [Zostera marina]